MGQTLKPYRIHLLKDSSGAAVDVGDIASYLAPTFHQNTIGINNLGVVGGVFEASSGSFHGFVWFPNNLGVSGMAFPLRQLIDIHPYAFSGGTSDHTIVNDVHADRALLGFRGSTIGTTGHAHAFTLNLTTPSITAVDLHTTSGSFSNAFGVNDAATASIVGVTTVACEEDDDDFVGPFQTTWSSGGGPGTMTILPTADEGFLAAATDIARTNSTFLAAGEVDACEADEDDDICTTITCSEDCLFTNRGAIRWTSTTSSPSSSFDPLDGLENEDSGVYGRGINDDGDVAGWGWAGTDPNCDRRAAFWNGGSVTSHIPGDTMPHDQEDDESWAEALTPRDVDGCVTLVGFNLFQDFGVIWHGMDDSWCAEDLNNLVLPCAYPTTMTIVGAYDINQYRHITVLVDDDSVFRIAVLSSAADFDGNLKVDGSDRNALIAHYCSTCTSDYYDLDCDLDVDADDLALLLGTYYSGTGLATVPAICECEQQESMSSQSSGIDESTALAGLGFTSWQALSDWLMTAEEVTADSVCDELSFLLHGG